jgi:hypothetical protein
MTRLEDRAAGFAHHSQKHDSEAWIYNLDTRALGVATGACYRLDVFMNHTNGPTGIVISNATWAVFRPVK